MSDAVLITLIIAGTVIVTPAAYIIIAHAMFKKNFQKMQSFLSDK